MLRFLSSARKALILFIREETETNYSDVLTWCAVIDKFRENSLYYHVVIIYERESLVYIPPRGSIAVSSIDNFTLSVFVAAPVAVMQIRTLSSNFSRLH